MDDAPRVDWRFAAGCAALLALLFGTQQWLNAPDDAPVAYWFAIRRASAVWAAWLALLPLIVAAGRTNPLGADSRWRWVWRHLWLAGAFWVGHSALAVLFRAMVGVPAGGDPVSGFFFILYANLAGDVLRYSLISLSYQAVAYHRVVRVRDAEAARLQLDLAESKLANLEGRLRPHFLFNTLNSIAALIRVDPNAAETMVEQLSELLRASLRADPSREVRLDEELRLVEQYLAIQRVRFEDRLTVSLQATDAARRAYVPQLILQPLVENAVRHGIGPRESGGTVWIRADQPNGRLRISVEDDGVGMGNAPPAYAGNGLGLGGVKSRLAHLYGVDHRVEVAPRTPAGTRVTIDIPYRTESHDR